MRCARGTNASPLPRPFPSTNASALSSRQEANALRRVQSSSVRRTSPDILTYRRSRMSGCTATRTISRRCERIRTRLGPHRHQHNANGFAWLDWVRQEVWSQLRFDSVWCSLVVSSALARSSHQTRILLIDSRARRSCSASRSSSFVPTTTDSIRSVRRSTLRREVKKGGVAPRQPVEEPPLRCLRALFSSVATVQRCSTVARNSHSCVVCGASPARHRGG